MKNLLVSFVLLSYSIVQASLGMGLPHKVGGCLNRTSVELARTETEKQIKGLTLAQQIAAARNAAGISTPIQLSIQDLYGQVHQATTAQSLVTLQTTLDTSLAVCEDKYILPFLKEEAKSINEQHAQLKALNLIANRFIDLMAIHEHAADKLILIQKCPLIWPALSSVK